MIGKRAITWAGLILLGGIFIAVFAGVLEMRLTKGDIYPHYTTFRTDPLGSSGLYEAFGKIPGFTVEQNVESLMKVEGLDDDTALFLLGIPRPQFGRIRVPDSSPVLKAIKENGTRLILTIDPQSVPTEHINTLSDNEDEWLDRRKRERDEQREKLKDAKDSKSKPDKDKDKVEKNDEEDDDSKTEIEIDKIAELGPRLEHRFGVSIADVKKFTRPEGGWEADAGKSIQAEGITKNIPQWKSQYRFEIDEDSRKQWRVAATVKGEPVVVERKLGKGSIVLATDSFFASNEALYNGADSEFLLWLTGGKKRLVFDETLHGSTENTGAIKLLREFSLHGVLVGLLIFVILWAWKSASSLAPGDEATERGLVGAGEMVSGEDSKSGFIKLLQRNIPGSELIENCLATWKKSQLTNLSETTQKEISELTKLHKINPAANGAVSTYQKIAEILRKR